MSIEEEIITSGNIESIDALQEKIDSQFMHLKNELVNAGRDSMVYLIPKIPTDPIVTVRLVRIKNYKNTILSVGVHPLSGPPETYRLESTPGGKTYVVENTQQEINNNENIGRVLMITKEEQDKKNIAKLQRLSELLSAGQHQIFEENSVNSIKSQQGQETVTHSKQGRGMKPSRLQSHPPSSF